MTADASAAIGDGGEMMSYETVAGLVGKIRNARYGEMVASLEELINSGVWMDFTSPVGTRYKFLECEFDYFMLAMEIDPTIVRHAYLHADVDDLPVKQMRLSDITGRGSIKEGSQRRPRKEVIDALKGDKSGAARRISAGGQFVTELTSRIARDPQRRSDAEKGVKVRRQTCSRWLVEWSDGRTTAEAIVEKLLADKDLAETVYNKLAYAKQKEKRRSALVKECESLEAGGA